MNKNAVFAKILVLMDLTQAKEDEIVVNTIHHHARDVQIIQLIAPEETFVINVHNKFIAQIRSRIEKLDLEFLYEELQDNPAAGEYHQGYVYRDMTIQNYYRFKANFMESFFDLTTQYVSPGWDGVVTGDLVRVENNLVKVGEQLAGALRQIKHIFTQWQSSHKLNPLAEYYWSFDLTKVERDALDPSDPFYELTLDTPKEREYLKFCLDEVACISNEGIHIERTPLTHERVNAWAESDQHFGHRLIRAVAVVNEAIDRYWLIDAGETLCRFKLQQMREKVLHPIMVEVNGGLRLNPSNPIVVKKQDEEVQAILEQVKQLSEGRSNEVFMDANSCLVWENAPTGPVRLEEQPIIDRWGTYTHAFSNGLDSRLNTMTAYQLRPFARKIL